MIGMLMSIATMDNDILPYRQDDICFADDIAALPRRYPPAADLLIHSIRIIQQP